MPSSSLNRNIDSGSRMFPRWNDDLHYITFVEMHLYKRYNKVDMEGFSD